MKTTFALIALIGAVSAGPLGTVRDSRHGGKLADDPKFLSYCSKYNKNVSDTRTFERKQRRYHENDTVIADWNRQHAHSTDPNTLVLGHNFTSDMEPEEYQKLLGRVGPEHNNTLIEDRPWRDGGADYRRGRGLQAVQDIDRATTVDHYKDGYIHDTKDQGSCGSCWSFAAVTSLEGTIALKYNRGPERLSEQSLVDCTLTTEPSNETKWGKDYGMWGCQGGLLPPAWDFIRDHGIMKYTDYPYTSGSSAKEGTCIHETAKSIPQADWPKTIHMYTPNNTVSEVKAKVKQQPLSISLDASRAAFQFYKSGVVPQDANCGTQLNHAIVVVGYSDGGDDGSNDGDQSSDDTNPTPPTPPNPTPTGNCKVKKWWHTCEAATARRNLQNGGPDASGFNNYWLMQNQWGTDWGDKGFIRIEISGGTGACGMNKEIEWAEIDMNVV